MTNRLRTAAFAALLTIALAGSIQLRAVDGEPAGVTLRELIQTAYASQDELPRPIVDGPTWMETERFHVDRRALVTAGPTATAALRTLLADRFKLRVHTEVAERQRYALVLATPAIDLRLQFVGSIVRRTGATAGSGDDPASLMTLLHEPLELTLERRRDRVDVMVVDYAELPSAN